MNGVPLCYVCVGGGDRVQGQITPYADTLTTSSIKTQLLVQSQDVLILGVTPGINDTYLVRGESVLWRDISHQVRLSPSLLHLLSIM